MKKQLKLIGILTIFIGVGLSGCEEVNNLLNIERNKFIGTWFNSTRVEYIADQYNSKNTSPNTSIFGHYNYFNTTMAFFSNGTVSRGIESGTWELKDGKLVTDIHDLHGNNIGVNIAYTYSFSNNDRTLTLTATGSSWRRVFTKQ